MATQVTLNSGSVDSAGSLALKTNGTTTAVTIDTSQNVGIGETSPTTKLDVKAALGRIKLTSSTGTNNALVLFNNTGGNAYVGLDSSVGSLTAAYALNLYHEGAYPITFSTNSAERMRIDSSGTLLIGRTAASTSKLHIQTVDTTSSNFAAIFQDSATVNLFYVRNDGVGYLKAASWTYGSDISLKENVRYLDSNNSLSLITKAKPASFDYINSQKENYGFIAQDVQTWFPEAVVETEGGTLGLKTEFFIPLMVGSIQALNNLIQEQQALITSLTDRITALEEK